MRNLWSNFERPGRWTRGWGQDVVSAVRGLRKQPLFSAMVVATLAIGIGANTLAFSFVDALLIDPLPYPEASRLVRIEARKGGEPARLSGLEVLEFAERTDIFESISSYRPGAQYVFGEPGSAEEVPATLVSGSIFETLGVPLLHGAKWPATADRERSFEVVLGYDFWRRRFGGDPAVVGTTIALDNAPGYTIHGVLPPGFDFPQRVDIYRSIAITRNWVEDPSLRLVFAVGRLAPGVSVEQARTALDAAARRLAEIRPEANRGIEFQVAPLEEMYVGHVRPYVLLLFSAVGLVLLIVCANLANLLLSRAARRQRETAIRAALGTDSVTIARRFLTESLLLSILGGAAGLAMAVPLLNAVRATALAEMPQWIVVEPNARVALFTLGTAMLAALLTGLAPAALAASGSGLDALKTATRTTSGVGQGLVRRSFVVAQIALALTVIVGAGLMVRSFDRLRRAELGFEPERLLTYQVALTWRQWNLGNSDQFYRPLIEQIAQLPGVESVAVNTNLPLSPTVETNRMAFEVEGRGAEEKLRDPYVDVQHVSPAYFETMQIGLRAGRLFDEHDGKEGAQVAILAGSLADTLWPGADPLGRRMRIAYGDGMSEWLEIVGVVDDVQHRDVAAEAGKGLYVSFFQLASPNAYVVVRTAQDPMSLSDAATRAVWAVDSSQAFFDIETMRARVDGRLWRQRLSSAIFSVFGALAAVLASLGIYGVMSYFVAARTREIGIRLALGATGGHALRLVLGEALGLTLWGLLAGGALAFALFRLTPSLPFDFQPSDWRVAAGAPAFLAAIAFAASLAPALRAARVEPLVSLRSE